MLKTLRRHGVEIALAMAVVLMVGMMIVPLPTWLLDVLLATNLSIAVLLLVVALFVRDALGFGAFPTILLVTTLYRLALNVSSTRLILLQADAGRVIESFGEFVVRGNYVVGAVVFAILTLIQLIVIARGAERVAEVGARFTLDAMPGKQLAIDADLRAGILDADRAAQRRRALERESQFYGAMDGAMKFVKGDAIAAIVIIVVNIVGGLAIGVLMNGMSALDALRVYGLLTIGDGLVSQIPALLISTAAGLVVTRVASEDRSGTLGGDIGAQIFGDWRALGVAAVFMLVLAIVPGLPLVPFLVLAAVFGAAAFAVRRRTPDAAAPSEEDAPTSALAIEVGTRLAHTIARDPELAEGLRAVRSEIHAALGVRTPIAVPVRSERLDLDAYAIVLDAVPVDRGRCPHDRVFVHAPSSALRELDPGVEIDGDGGWIASSLAARARQTGLDPRTPAQVIGLRVADAIRARPEALMGIEETQREIDRIAKDAPALVRAIVPERIGVPRLAALLRALLAENVSIRPMREILEALGRDPLPARDAALVDTIRERLAKQLTHGLVREDGVLSVFALDPAIEESIRDGLRPDGEVAIDPELARDVADAVKKSFEDKEGRPILLTQPDVRAALRKLLAAELPQVTILSYRELDPKVQVQRLGVVGASGP
jgi:type III secretion protein V